MTLFFFLVVYVGEQRIVGAHTGFHETSSHRTNDCISNGDVPGFHLTVFPEKQVTKTCKLEFRFGDEIGVRDR